MKIINFNDVFFLFSEFLNEMTSNQNAKLYAFVLCCKMYQAHGNLF